MDKSNKSTDTKSHILFRDTYEEIVDNKIIKGTHFKLYVGDFPHDDDPLTSKLIYELQKSKPNDKITVYIQSPGGSTKQGLALIDVITDRFFGKVTTEILHAASSMGSMMFCSGDIRIVNENSQQMMHNYSGGFNSLKASDLRTRVDFTQKHLGKIIKKIYLSNGFLSKKQFNNLLNGKEYWFDADSMIKKGIATHIRVDGKLLSKKEYKNVDV